MYLTIFKMISQFKITSKWRAFALSVLICSALYSCKDSKDSVASSGKASVNIRLLGIQNPIVTNKKASTGNPSISNQTIVVPFTKTSAFKATFTNESNRVLQGGSGKRAAVVEERTPLADNVKYKIVVYNNDNYVTEKIYTNSVDNDSEIILDAGKMYTFVAYSINSTSTVPAVTSQTTLATATIDNVSADLMYFKKDLTLQLGSNNLDIVLKHMYSEVTTNVNMATEMTGAITNLTTSTISPSHPSANLKLTDGTITYNSPITTAAVTFPSLGAGLRAVSSIPTVLIHPGTANGVFNFGSITIDGETKSNVSVSGLQIVPGQRYNLNLNFKTCTQPVGGGVMDWNYPAAGSGTGANVDGVFTPNGQVITRTLTAPGADYGFVFDILELDNSFNMEVNGTKLNNSEIQFQSGVAGSPVNIKFADGSAYNGTNTQGGTVPHVYDIHGTTTNPTIRVIISRSGAVSMYGSKSSGGPLYPLALTQGAFNTVPWNSVSNTVKVTQIITGTTAIKGSGTGRQKITCP